MNALAASLRRWLEERRITALDLPTGSSAWLSAFVWFAPSSGWLSTRSNTRPSDDADIEWFPRASTFDNYIKSSTILSCAGLNSLIPQRARTAPLGPVLGDGGLRSGALNFPAETPLVRPVLASRWSARGFDIPMLLVVNQLGWASKLPGADPATSSNAQASTSSDNSSSPSNESRKRAVDGAGPFPPVLLIALPLRARRPIAAAVILFHAELETIFLWPLLVTFRRIDEDPAVAICRLHARGRHPPSARAYSVAMRR